MSFQDIQWAIDTLDEEILRVNELVIASEQCADVPTSLFHERQRYSGNLHHRHAALLKSIETGKEIHLLPEFTILCLQVQELSRQKVHTLFSKTIMAGSLHVLSECMQSISRLIACVELRILSCLGTRVVKYFMERGGLEMLQEGDVFSEEEYARKTMLLRDIVQETADIRFIEVGTQIFGFQDFQDMRHRPIITDQ